MLQFLEPISSVFISSVFCSQNEVPSTGIKIQFLGRLHNINLTYSVENKKIVVFTVACFTCSLSDT